MLWSKMEVEFKDSPDDKENFYQIDCILFIISLVVVFSKAVIGYWPSLTVSFFYLLNGFGNMFLYLPVGIFATLWISLEWLIKPVIFGIMMSFITWQIVYLDSDIPGYRPVTPFSFSRYHARSKRANRFHLCYIFALAVAPLITVSLILTNCAL